MKKIFSALLSLVLLVSCIFCVDLSAYAMRTDAQTDNISCTYDIANKTLFVNGKGKIPGYFLGYNWEWDNSLTDEYYDYKISDGDKYYYELIKHSKEDGTATPVELDEYMQDYIYHNVYGDYYYMNQMVEKIVIGEGITDIQGSSFNMFFNNLKTVQLPSTLKSIENLTFAVTAPKAYADYDGSRDVHIVIPENVKSVGNYVGNTITVLGKNTELADLSYNLGKGPSYIKMVYCYSGSKAEQACKKAGVNYTLIKTPSAVTDLKAASTTATKAKLTWKKAKNASNYQIQKYNSSTKKWTTVATTKDTAYTVTGLSQATTYKFRVRAYCSAGDAKIYGKFSSAVKATTKPDIVSFTEIKAKSKGVALKWSSNSKATGYQIQYSTSSSFASSSTTSVTVKSNKTTSKTIDGLKANKTYYFRIRAYKTVDGTKYYGAWSNSFKKTTKK